MADIYIKRGTSATVNPPIGYSLLNFNVGVTQVTQELVIQPERNFAYYNQEFLNALNNGIISQSIYDIIIGNQDTTRQLYIINSNLNIDKQLLIDLVNRYRIQNVDTGAGTAPQIVEDIINEGFMVVKKI